MSEIDEYVNESGVIDDPYFILWSDMMDKKDQEAQDKEFERLFNETESQGKEPF